MADERLNRAEQQLAKAKRRADEAAKQMEEVKVCEEVIRVQVEMMAKHSEQLSREANERLLVAIACAEKAEQVAAEKVRETIACAEIAEQHSAEKISEAEKRVQRAAESAVQLEQKFTDAMKRMDGSTSTGMQQQLNLELKRLTRIPRAIADKVKESIAEVEKKAQRAVESAVQLEQKFTDVMKRLEGSTSTGMRQQLNLELKRLTCIPRTNGH